MSNIKPLGNDVLLKFRTTEGSNFTDSGIYIKDNDKNTEFEYYDVVAVGEKVTSVAVGDVALISWAKMTPPFKHEGSKYGVTSEYEILAVLEV